MGEITKKEFLELLQEFSDKNLDPKFQKIDAEFEKIDERFERIDSKFVEFKKEIVHEFHIISEGVINKLQLVGEGLINLDEKFSRRMDDLERKNEEQHRDILAAVKFSYAELDKRITTLESEVKDLKLRMDKIERRSVS
jgi:uncharacterized protein with HEPN domain